MASYNRVILAGNLTRDPELRYTPKGTAVIKLGLAMNRRWRDESGQSREEATFVDVEAYGKQAETISQYLRKGSPLLIEGRLRYDTWDDKQTNQKRSRLLVVCESFQFLDSNRNREGGAPDAPRSSAAPAASSAASPPPAEAHHDADPAPTEDDVPF
jgi:single-strand DNA-binding protein